MRRQVSISFFFFTSFTLSDHCCLHTWNQFGLMLAQGWMYVSKVNHKSQCATFYKFEQPTWPICNHHDHPMTTCWNIYVQTLSQSNFHHNMEIHYLSVHWTWSWSTHFNYKALIGVWHLATKAKVIVCLFLLFYYFLNSFFTTLTLPIFLRQHAPKRSSARNASSSIKTPWVLGGASSNYHSMIAYS